MAQRQHVADAHLHQLAGDQVGLDRGGHRHLHAQQVAVQRGAFDRRRLAARAVPGAREAAAHGLDRRGRNGEVQDSARFADFDIEAEEQDDLVRRRHLQHLRPRFTAADAEVHVHDAAPRLGQVLEQQLDDGVDDVLLDLGERAVDADAAAAAAEHAIDHREGDRRVQLERAQAFERPHRRPRRTRSDPAATSGTRNR